ncbi:MAG: CD225/dispanin family protein [Muribaculaceae bacterium]|nr:CD225/dispanin family protein [Muribaculaceae bacterium]
MRNIAILVSGEGAAASRVVKLFNEGNRVHTVLVVVDETTGNLGEELAAEGVDIFTTNDETWSEDSIRVAGKIREKEVNLLVLDNFDKVLPAELIESTNGELLRLTSPELAPREVVNALEAELRRKSEEGEGIQASNRENGIDGEEVANYPAEAESEAGDASPEREWADALKINFTPPKIPTTPPEVPTTPSDLPRDFEPEQRPSFGTQQFRNEDQGRRHTEPMPSTWLIWSILVTVFCCFIPGIIAIIFSSQVSSRYYAGDVEGARRSSRNAEIWIIVSFVLGVISATLYLPFMLIG